MPACNIRRVVPAPVASVYQAFVDGTVFKLTGASSIRADIGVGGEFQLVFEGRGSISGTFLYLAADEGLHLAWNVCGFGRADEKTRVEVAITGSGRESEVEIRHLYVGSPESAAARGRSWEEILSELAALISSIDRTHSRNE